MNDSYSDLSNKVNDMSGVSGPSRQVIIAQSYQIKAIEKLDSTINDLNNSIKKLDKSTTRLMKVQIYIAIAGIMTAIIIAICVS